MCAASALSEYTQIALFPQKLAASLLGWLGITCLFPAALGLYSVISSRSISARRRSGPHGDGGSAANVSSGGASGCQT